MAKIAIFREPFDPITNLSLTLARDLFSSLGADKIVFVPQNMGTASYFDRSMMVKKTIEPFSFALISYALDKKERDDDDLLKHFQRKFPNDEVFFVSWSDEKEDKAILETEGNFRSGKKLDAPLYVLNYVTDKQLYFIPLIVKSMHLHRFNHSVSVAKTAYDIAEGNSLIPSLAYQAGLFHDIGKDLNIGEQIEIMHKAFPNEAKLPDFALHQFVSAYIAKTAYGIENREVLKAISYHCTGCEDMDEYMKCLFVADKAEPTRQFPTSKMRIKCIQNLDEGFVYVLNEHRDYFLHEHLNYRSNSLTDAMYKKYIDQGDQKC